MICISESWLVFFGQESVREVRQVRQECKFKRVGITNWIVPRGFWVLKNDSQSRTSDIILSVQALTIAPQKPIDAMEKFGTIRHTKQNSSTS